MVPRYAVPPAELENDLLQHPDIADAGVVGVYSEADATELPRSVSSLGRSLPPTNGLNFVCNRAYVVHKKGIRGAERRAFAQEVQEWIKGRVAKHKYLRGGKLTVIRRLR